MNYDEQNVILREVNMNERSAVAYSVDHDRALMWDYTGFRALLKETVGTGELGIGHWSQSASKKDLLAFGNKLYELTEGKQGNFKGIRIIRNTNVGSGYPVFTIQLGE